MATDINVSQLIINKLTQAQYDEAKAAGNISESELYFVTDDNEVEIADVIAEHNTSPDAHADIRASIPSIAGLATEQYVNDVAGTKTDKAFSNVVVGSTTIAADTATDTLTLVAGSNVTITPDAANDKITIAATDTVYTLPVATSSELGGVKSGTDVTIDANGNVSINDDSHNHVIDNVDGLQDVLNEKMSSTDPTGTGSFSINRKSNTTIGTYSFAEGGNTEASGYASHAEGYGTKASLDYSHAEGYSTIASGYQSHAEGMGTEAKGNSQHVQGKYNIVDTTSLHIVGNGASESAKSNAHTIDEDGNAWFSGDVYVDSTSGTNKDEGSKKLATEAIVDEKIAALVNSAPETLDTLGELATAFNENKEVVDALDEAITNKANKDDVYTKAEVDAAIAAAIEAAFANIARAEEVAF